MTSERDTRHFDAAVIGGGAAGLSAAVALGRARRS
jgi:thioredoxin reductase